MFSDFMLVLCRTIVADSRQIEKFTRTGSGFLMTDLDSWCKVWSSKSSLEIVETLSEFNSDVGGSD